MGYTLRKYQKEAVDAVFKEWKQGHEKTLLVLATGTGKTIIFANVAKRCVERNEHVLVLAHRGELIQQAHDKIKDAVDIDSDIEKAERTAVGSDKNIVIASMQTLVNENRLKAYPQNYFQTIIIDEAHHALSDSYQKILKYFNNAKVLGVTATAERGDKKNLAVYFNSVAYEYSMMDAIGDNPPALAPIQAMTVPINIDISDVGTTLGKNGDYIASELGDALEPYLAAIGKEISNTCGNRKTMVFTPLIKISQEFVGILNKNKNLNACEVNGETKDRDKIIKDFEAGKYNVLVNSMLLTEGFDCPAVDCVVILRATKSHGLYVQMVGRGTRLCEGKKDLLLLDFLWQTAKHNLCRPAELVTDDPEIAKQITRDLENGRQINLLDAKETATNEVIQSKLEEQKHLLTSQLIANKNRQRQSFNPFELASVLKSEKLMNYEPTFAWENQRMTDKQKEMLKNNGIDLAKTGVSTKGQASCIIDILVKRRKNDLCSYKQIKLLENKGFKNVNTWTKAEASEMINIIAENKWKVPYSIKPATYNPKKTRLPTNSINFSNSSKQQSSFSENTKYTRGITR